VRPTSMAANDDIDVLVPAPAAPGQMAQRHRLWPLPCLRLNRVTMWVSLTRGASAALASRPPIDLAGADRSRRRLVLLTRAELSQAGAAGDTPRVRLRYTVTGIDAAWPSTTTRAGPSARRRGVGRVRLRGDDHGPRPAGGAGVGQPRARRPRNWLGTITEDLRCSWACPGRTPRWGVNGACCGAPRGLPPRARRADRRRQLHPDRPRGRTRRGCGAVRGRLVWSNRACA